jgi:hypothetical protein
MGFSIIAARLLREQAAETWADWPECSKKAVTRQAQSNNRSCGHKFRCTRMCNVDPRATDAGQKQAAVD